MALNPFSPVWFRGVFGYCGSKPLPTYFLKAPGVFPLLWTATLLALRTVPRPSCSVVFAAVAIHDCSQVNRDVPGVDPQNAEGSLLVDAGKADADGALFKGVASTTNGGGARPQVGNLRRVLHPLLDILNEGKSTPDGFGSEGDTDDVDSADVGSHGEEESRKSSPELSSTHYPRSDGLSQEGFSVSEQPGTGELLQAPKSAHDDEGEAHNQPPPKLTHDEWPLPDNGFPAGEEEVKGSDRDAGDWSGSDVGSRPTGGEEVRWIPGRSTHTQKTEPAPKKRVKRRSREAPEGTEEPEIYGSQKISHKTPARDGLGMRKRRHGLDGKAMGVLAILAAVGIALLGGGAFAARRRAAATRRDVRR